MDNLSHILFRLRALDRRELLALRYSDDEETMAREYLEYSTPGWVACDDKTGEPVYAFGLHPQRPGVWSVWGFGTPLFPRVALTVTRTVKKIICPITSEFGHRFECICLADKTDAIRWLKHIGLTEEATLSGFGRDKEDFKLMVWRV